MAVKLFERPFDYTPGVTKKVVEGEPHTIPTSPPHDIYLHHIPREGTVVIPGYTEVDGTPGAGQFRVHYTEQSGAPRGRITFSEADAGKSVAVNYHACGTLIWAEDRGDGRPNIAELQEVLERVQEAGGIDYGSSGFVNVKAALDALVGVRIVEMSSNSNGTYVRWENGLQVCLLPRLTLPRQSSGQAYAVWTFPAAFVNTNYSVHITQAWATGDAPAQKVTMAFTQTHSTSNCTPTLASKNNDLADGESWRVQLVAIGRWK